MTTLYVAECSTDSRRVLADIRHVLQLARPELVSEFDAIDLAATNGVQFADWLRQQIGMDIDPVKQPVRQLPSAIAKHLGVVGFEPDWDIGD